MVPRRLYHHQCDECRSQPTEQLPWVTFEDFSSTPASFPSTVRWRFGSVTGRGLRAVPAESMRRQAVRCMDCGIPFCHEGCPLGNLIPEWNDLVYQDHWGAWSRRLHATNSFPDFTGRVCPRRARHHASSASTVTTKQIEYEIAERAWAEGWLTPILSTTHTGRRVAIVGSCPGSASSSSTTTRRDRIAGSISTCRSLPFCRSHSMMHYRFSESIASAECCANTQSLRDRTCLGRSGCSSKNACCVGARPCARRPRRRTVGGSSRRISRSIAEERLHPPST